MSGEFEAAGAMATAGLIAGAIEGRQAHGAGEGACANCAAQITGNYCASCGQASHPHRTLAHVFEEFLHGVIHFDTKAWRTLPMVIFRPGTLTRNYVYGKRARYISPLALFLFTIFLMFFAFSFVHAPVNINGAPQEQRSQAVEGVSEARADLAQAQRELAQARAAPAPTVSAPPGLETALARQAVERAEAAVQRDEQMRAGVDPVIAQRPASASAEPAATETAADGAAVAPGETWQDALRRAAARDDFVVIEGMPELSERIRHKFENPDLALYKIQQAAYKFSFLLVPISLPFIALLFLWKRKLTLYDHVVYTLYALSFASILFVAIAFTSMSSWTSWIGESLIAFGLPIHSFFHLGGAYALGWWSALWRTFFMLIFACLALALFIIVIVVLGLAG